MARLPLTNAFLELAEDPHNKDLFQVEKFSHLPHPSRAAAPEIISVSSVVMAACRVLRAPYQQTQETHVIQPDGIFY